MHHPGIWGRGIAPLQHPSYQRPQQSRPLIPGISAISRERIAASPCMWFCRVGGAALPPPSPLRTVRDHFQSHGSSLAFAPCGTRFHHGQTSVLPLPVTVGVEEEEIVHAVPRALREPDDVMTVPW